MAQFILCPVVTEQKLLPELATSADIPAVIALIGSVYKEYEMIYVPVEEVLDLFEFAQHYAEPYGAFFTVRDQGQIVGSVGVELLTPNKAELHRLYLDASLRGRGLGRALVEAVVAWCRAKGVTHLLLWSDTRFDRSHMLYERMGFQRTGERETHDINHSREYRYERSV
jgi:putative acetyltransferase